MIGMIGMIVADVVGAVYQNLVMTRLAGDMPAQLRGHADEDVDAVFARPQMTRV